MEQPQPQPPPSVAERCYERQKKAQRDYYRRKHPNPKPIGRPRKAAVSEPPKVDSAVQNE